jgi:RNA polymerase sigma factor (TIGR02999 family)
MSSGIVTQLLIEWKQGNKEALNKLIPLIYNELKHIAKNKLKNERVNISLQPTMLVNEAYLRLIGCDNIDWKNRVHFFGVAAQLMRNILVDHARKNIADKRGGEHYTLSISNIPDLATEKDLDLVALDDALRILATIDPQQCRIVELKYFAGLDMEEIAHVLSISTATISREWKMAKLWLLQQLDNTKK